VTEVRARYRKQLRKLEFKAAEADQTIATLRAILKAWEPRVLCGQCGQRYSELPCGPTHAIVKAQVCP
jgi:hypothetical protein